MVTQQCRVDAHACITCGDNRNISFRLAHFSTPPKRPQRRVVWRYFFLLFEVHTAFLLSCSLCSSLKRICTIPLRHFLVNACVNFVLLEAVVDQSRSSRYQITLCWQLVNICVRKEIVHKGFQRASICYFNRLVCVCEKFIISIGL